MVIVVDSRRKSPSTLEKIHPDAKLLDVTSRGPDPWVRFSPFFPHGGIPVPNSTTTSESVEGVWQGLKVFDSADVDEAKFRVRSMSGIKRSVRSNGRVRGHRFGVDSDDILDYRTARFRIYLPSYRWVLQNRLQAELNKLAEILTKHSIVLLDYETNSDVNELSRPLSHASLIVAFLLNQWPTDSIG